MNEKIPPQLDILFFQPAAEDNLSEDEYFTYIATAGMSTRIMQEPCKHVELILCVQERQPQAALELLGRRLAELAVLPFREGTSFTPNLLLYDVSLPLFERMDCALITNWGVYSPEWLPGIQPPVQLLSVKPVYKSEADIIEGIGDIEVCRRFRNEGINWDNPKRSPANLQVLPTIVEFEERRSVMAGTDVKTTIQNIWNDIKEWYTENASSLLENLKDGVSDQELREFEERVGLALPDDYKASLKLHNGDVYIHDYNYLSLDGVLNRWLRMKKMSEEGGFEGREVFEAGEGIIQNTWWHPGWIPFAEDGGGNLICIDMAPDADGVVGQILNMELRSGPGVSEYTSFLEYLEHYKDDLYAGVYEVDEDGYIIEKLD
ncbi:SMI1/KNR4 family protein [Coleofasciculus sp. LEGE 07081]|uniref:SMI1/KNR4 family protein n=1 Tax=Coleofasciculus sp. LEGE 07081 TaxID=2777967 RepID=UPI001D1477DA|nr:SMI1/KNR4 family protein [Coleofasciculus sp. LEGE 07081]